MHRNRKPFQIFLQSPELDQIRHESVTGDQTLSNLKRSLFPESHHILPSFYFTLHGKPLPDNTPLSNPQIVPHSTLVLRSRLHGGGADGGPTVPEEVDKVVINGSEDEVPFSGERMEKENTRMREEEKTDASSLKSSSDEDESETVRSKRRKVELETTEESTLEGAKGQSLEASLENVCTHPGSSLGMCIRCGQKLDGESGVPFNYIHKGPRLLDEEMPRLRNTEMNNLLFQKKLCLVLDLDHTLLNTTCLAYLSSKELYLHARTDSLGDICNGSLFKFKLEGIHMMTKLRPFVRTFLKEASEMFEMYIYTMGGRPYAVEMAKLLDPLGEYFIAKVISRDDGTQKDQKSLDIIPGQESAVLILDDTELVWMKHTDNLILPERYLYFSSSCRQFGIKCKSLAELEVDECETNGTLARILNVLRRVHNTFFDKLEEDLVDRDVRKILSSVRSELLSGCVIVFSESPPATLPTTLRKMAEQMGATCLTEVDPSVTHVVATDAGTEKSQWAVKEKKFLVNRGWIEAANYLWQKQPEENFVLKNKN